MVGILNSYYVTIYNLNFLYSFTNLAKDKNGDDNTFLYVNTLNIGTTPIEHDYTGLINPESSLV